MIFGDKLRLLMTQRGAIRSIELAPAHLTDLEVGDELLHAQAHLMVLGDTGYISRPLATNLRAARQVDLVTVPPAISGRNPPRPSATFGCLSLPVAATTRFCGRWLKRSTVNSPSIGFLIASPSITFRTGLGTSI